MVSVAFFGSHPLGEACLERLVAHDEITVETVVTYPRDYDAWWDGSVHERALDHDLPVLTVRRGRSGRRAGLRLPPQRLLPEHPRAGSAEHAPGGRAEPPSGGTAPLQGSNVFSHSIMNGAPERPLATRNDPPRHGRGLDAGDVIDRKFVPITEEDTARTLYERVRGASVELFEERLPRHRRPRDRRTGDAPVGFRPVSATSTPRTASTT
nr:hypothetical protein [Halorientalis sp. IM1011]